MESKNSKKGTDKNTRKMSAEKPQHKKLNLEQFYGKVIALVVRHSPAELSYSRISQLTQVPRPTLYYYFGKDPEAMFQEALRYGMKRFVLLYDFEKGVQSANWKSFQKERLRAAIDLIKRFPWAPALYFRYRNHPGEWGKEIREIEKNYMKNMAEVWKRFHGKAPDEKALRVSAYLKLGLLWGMASEFDVWFKNESTAELEKIVDQMTDWVTQGLEG